MTSKRSNIAPLAWQVSTLLAVLVAWQWAAVTNPTTHLPPLQLIFTRYLDLLWGDLLWSAVAPSILRLLIGFSIAVLFGAVLGIVIGSLRWFEPFLRPVIEYLRFIPAVAVLPAALLVFGATDTMRIFVIAFGSVFPVLLAAIDGARRAEELLTDVARICGLSTAERLFRVTLPAASPLIFAGIRIALSIALVMMVISELIAADNGLGYYILRSQRLFQTANVYAGVLMIGTIGLVLTLFLLTFEKRVLAWHRGWRGLSNTKSA
ncbi:ABC transporter permease [Microvirga pakistanensis]|uniref:ABC transporter permease n=1 Tax=Microvirga pakistanensis TaxID=1682650 RepID=UPI00141BB768|nr:ABC transporter permease [Microvirga pakistanensis]